MKNTKNEFIIKIIISLIIISSIIFVLGCNFVSGNVLVIQNNTTGIKTEFYLPDSRFSLGYIHSVMKTPAEEFFYINENNDIILEKTIYESFGVGLPFLADSKDFELKDGKFILYTKRTFKQINMIISPIPKHYLQIGDTKYQLMDILKESDCSITIYVQEKKILKSLFNFSSNIIFII